MKLLPGFLALILTSSIAAVAAEGERVATPAAELTVPEGFKVELLRSAQAQEGSWVSMTIDDKGRLYVSPQGKEKMLRITLDTQGQIEKLEPVEVPVTGAMGMLWAFNSLYVSGVGPEGQALYRIKDSDANDQLDQVTLFKKVPGGGGEHGAHAIVLGPDQKLYLSHGNSTPLPEGIDPKSAYRHYAEDSLLPRIMDPVATFFSNLKIPYGQVLRTDENGSKWEIFAAGFRNQYDIDFNPDGELFTYDSDMEWEVGLPWYRPTRILHITSGAEFGFREGNTKWPEFYEDSVGSVVDTGLGSPTGVKFGTKSNFPPKYQRAFYVLDWTFGRILAIHLTPGGASYSGQSEDFLKGKGMPVTDLEFGKDGAMYFLVGGRGTQSGLYRVSWTGAASKSEVVAQPELQGLRRSMEVFHNVEDNKAIEQAWASIGEPDRRVRFAARIAIENQPLAQWQERALAEKEPRKALSALLALARCGDASTQAPLLKALTAFPLDSLDEPLKLEKLRVITVSFMRQGRPSDELVQLGIEKLSRQYPAASFALNHELSQLLVWLGTPDVVAKTLALLEKSEKPEEQIWFANVLREANTWTPAERERYFTWFKQAHTYKGGNSFSKFIDKIKDLAIGRLTTSEREPLTALLKELAPAPKVAPPAPAREFQKLWTMTDLEEDLDQASKGRNFARGKEIFSSTQCLQCHHFGQDGGNVGPDLSAVGNRFRRRDLLEAIIEPSKAISEQYASYVFTMKNGDAVMGQVAEETNEHYLVVVDPIGGGKERLGKKLLASKQVSPVSLMPPGLISTLTKEEIFDLLAYIESAGNAKSKHFAP